jgi:hypothetical protein
MAQPSVGLETRNSILPTPEIPKKTPGVFGPDYSFADNIPLPGEVGVRDGGELGDVIDAVKGAAFYIDTIGFGQSSSALTRGMPLKPLGVQTWMRTGLKCSNGADAWMYVDGIPTGNALGKRVKDGLQSAGLPGMRGLAPGILEDVQSALDPVPIMGAVFGSGFPNCRFEVKSVGDQDGRIQNPATNAYYVENPESVIQKNGRPHQGRWVQDTNIDQTSWEKAPKTHCPNGFPIGNHRDRDCKKELQSTQMDGFIASQTNPYTCLAYATAIGGVLLLAIIRGSIHLRK